MNKGRTITVPSVNYSFVPNHQETMQALAKTPLNGRQLRLIILIMNQTDGYLREEDHLGPKFLEERTGIAEENCYHVLAGLKARGIVHGPKGWYKFESHLIFLLARLVLFLILVFSSMSY